MGRGKQYQVTNNVVFIVLLFVALFLMGLEIDINSVWDVMKKPIGPTIGFISQFIFMPLCAYGVAKSLLLNGKPTNIKIFQIRH